MKILLQGKEIVPESFNEYGEPIFSEEFAEFMKLKKEEVKKGFYDKFSILFNVVYKERKITIPLEDYDSIEGIEKYITCLDDFQKLIKIRKMHLKAYPDSELNQFIIFGKYFFDKFGNTTRITYINPIENIPDVCKKDDFLKMVSLFTEKWINTDFVPKDNTICPICSQEFTIEDLKNSEFDLINSRICHETCKNSYIEKKNIWHIVKDIMEYVYPNCTYETWEYSPVFTNPALLFKTEDGDIRIRRLGSEYYIEWQSNFKEFNLGKEYNIKKTTVRDGNRWDLITKTKSITVPTANAAIDVLQLAHLYNN
jgi:hypothetical protein